MKRKTKRHHLLRVVAEAAALQVANLPPLERADLLEGIALIHPDRLKAEHCQFTAFAIRNAEKAQLKLSEIFS